MIRGSGGMMKNIKTAVVFSFAKQKKEKSHRFHPMVVHRQFKNIDPPTMMTMPPPLRGREGSRRSTTGGLLQEHRSFCCYFEKKKKMTSSENPSYKNHKQKK